MIGSGKAGQRDGAWVGLAFLLFGAVVLGANGALIWYATASWPGLVTASPYDKGLTYNPNLEAAARQADLGWQTRFAARLTGTLDGEATLDLRDRFGAPLAGAEVLATFERPIEEHLDFAVPLQPAAPGTYRAGFTVPVPGAWNVHLTVRHGGELHVADERVNLR
jgi:nitrogen fixation protein FixH